MDKYLVLPRLAEASSASLKRCQSVGSYLLGWDDDEDDDGLPDAAFTEDELAAGVQHIMRTGDPNATFSGLMPLSWLVDDENSESTQEANVIPASASGASLRFETFAQARGWAQANPGGAFKRATDGRGFEAKPTLHNRSIDSAQPPVGSYSERWAEIESMTPHLHDVLTNSAGNHRIVSMRPFYRSTWEAELSRLNTAQLRRLRLVLAVDLDEGRKNLFGLTEEIKRNRRMKAGHYGEELLERIHEVIEGALKDIDRHLVKIPDSHP